MNISKLSLRALKDQISAGTREVTFQTDDGGITQMVYIPRFRVPAGLWEDGAFPPCDLTLGGFFIDKYQASHKAATSRSRGIGGNPTVPADSTADVALSLPGRVPWTDIGQQHAWQACANRKINGVACHLVTMQEWSTICFLTKLLGHDIRGNNNWGKDYRDPDAFEYFGQKDYLLDSYAAGYSKEMARVLTGSGPVSWSHNGQANGVFDIVGNVWEWIDFEMSDGIYTHRKTAQLDDEDGISATDATIVISNIQEVQNWPVSGWIMFLQDGETPAEKVYYGSITVHADGTATLSQCKRGQDGTTASTHADKAAIEQLTEYCVVPGGCSAITSGVGAADTTIIYEELILGPGCEGFAVGDILQVSTEQMKVTEVIGDKELRVERGANGSTAKAFDYNVRFVKISPQMSNTSPDSTDPLYGAYQSASFQNMRTEPDLLTMALPAVVGGAAAEYKDIFYARWYGVRAALRGGYWNDGSSARSGFALDLYMPPAYVSGNRGFRAALTL